MVLINFGSRSLEMGLDHSQDPVILVVPRVRISKASTKFTIFSPSDIGGSSLSRMHARLHAAKMKLYVHGDDCSMALSIYHTMH